MRRSFVEIWAINFECFLCNITICRFYQNYNCIYFCFSWLNVCFWNLMLSKNLYLVMKMYVLLIIYQLDTHCEVDARVAL